MTPPYYLDAIADQQFQIKFWSRTRPERWGCIEWRGARNRGYGVTSHGGHSLVAHRVSWMLTHDVAVPDGLVVDHLCGFLACVNPAHLEPVSSTENTDRFVRGHAGWVPVGVKNRRVLAADKWMYTPNGRLRPPQAA